MSEYPNEQRRRLILDRVRADGRVQVTDLATLLDVAVETVRRDLQVLEDQGFLRRTHGGAFPIDKAGFEARMAQRSSQRMAEKGRIADAAVGLLDACESLFIDEGSTAMAVAERLLATDSPLTIVTHSIPAAAALVRRTNTDVLMLGGRVRGASAATIGSSATAMLSDLTIDIAVLSASGISLERGLSTSDPETAELKRVAIKAASQRLFVGDHTKFGVSSFCRYADVQEFNAVITDSGLPTTVAARYKTAGTRLIRA